MAIIDVNNDEVIALTAKLEKMHRSAFPSAVRNTLNDVAFEHKRLMPIVAKQKFRYVRNKTFFKKITGVNKAEGFNINRMKSVSGLDSNANLGDSRRSDRIIANLEAQENGGIIKSRKLLTHNEGRVSKNVGKKTSKNFRHENTPFHDGTPAFKRQMSKSGSRGSAYISAIMSAKKAGKKHVLIKGGRKGKISGIVYKIGAVKKKKGKFNINMKKVYAYRDNENFNNGFKRTFISSSRKLAVKKIDDFYKAQAEFQFSKALRK